LTNPAEYLIDVVSIDNRNTEAEEVAELRVDRITKAWREQLSRNFSEKQSQTSGIVTKSSAGAASAKYTSFIQQTRVLTARTWVVTVRDPMGMIGSLVEAIGMVSCLPSSANGIHLTTISSQLSLDGSSSSWMDRSRESALAKEPSTPRQHFRGI
jgi:hypothetical protein